MQQRGLAAMLVCGLWLMPQAWADGCVVLEARLAEQATATIPRQRALIHWENGIERLVVETSFVGPGNDFAWVIPLPSVPRVQAVSTDLFPALEDALKPRLVPEAGRYFLVFLVAGVWVYLVRRAQADETAWCSDLPWCCGIALLCGLVMQSRWWGLAILGFMMLIRALRSKQNTALVTLAFIWGVLAANAFSPKVRLINSLGGDAGELEARPAVTVHSQESVGIYDTAVISSRDAGALASWLTEHGFALPDQLGPAVAEHVRAGWAFAAARVRRESAAAAVAALHPLGFTFKTEQPIYPLRLTAFGNDECQIELYVFGRRRAKARHFQVEHCRQTEFSAAARRLDPAGRVLRLSGGELDEWMRQAPVLTKLTGVLSHKDMQSDAQVKWTWFRHKRPIFYSRAAAAVTGLNVAAGLGVLCWLGILLTEGGWHMTAGVRRKWLWRMLPSALAVGLAVYCWLPKAAMVLVPVAGYGVVE